MAAVEHQVIPLRGFLPDAVRHDWDALLAGYAVVTPFHLADWYEIAWRSRMIALRDVILFRHAGRPVGLLAIQRRTRWTVEAPSALSAEAPPFLWTPGEEAAVLDGLAAWLRADTRIGMVSLGRFRREQIERMAALIVERGLIAQVRPVCGTVWAELPATWEDYLAGLTKSARSNVRRAESLIRQDFPDAQLEMCNDVADAVNAVEELIRLNCLRWRGEEHTYMEDPRTAAFYRRIIRLLVMQGRAAVGLLRVGGKAVAAASVLHLPGQPVACLHVVGRDLHALPKRYSPGILLASQTIRWAIERGATAFSLGQWVMPYKLVLGGVEYPQYELAVARSPLAAAVLQGVDPALMLAKGCLQRVVTRGLRLPAAPR